MDKYFKHYFVITLLCEVFKCYKQNVMLFSRILVLFAVSLNKPRRKSSKGYSFLESLSSNIPLTQAHPKAQAYKANFKKTKEQLAKVLFTLFNTEVFENKVKSILSSFVLLSPFCLNECPKCEHLFFIVNSRFFPV